MQRKTTPKMVYSEERALYLEARAKTHKVSTCVSMIEERKKRQRWNGEQEYVCLCVWVSLFGLD